MTEQPLPRHFIDARARAAATAIGHVIEIAGSGSQLALDPAALLACSHAGTAAADPVFAQAGSVGSQIKLRVGDCWVVANIRALRRAAPGEVGGTNEDAAATAAASTAGASAAIVAVVDFLGEGGLALPAAAEGYEIDEPAAAPLTGFRRGVTRYPMPGDAVYPVTSADLRAVYAAEDRATVEIGSVYPTDDIRAALYVDALLGKHFALLGSTGTGKSTAAALILHRICERAPNGHIVMIDPHGEYGAAFSDNGAIFDVSNLQMPYWLMNFAEHCEVFLTNRGGDRQSDADILAKCLLMARAKGRLGQEVTKLTVDAPVPYLLSDLTALITTEMGKLDRAGDTAPYLRLKTKIDEIKTDPRYGFMFSGMLVADTMAGFIERIFRMPGGGKPISIIDVSGVPSEITSVVVAVLSRMVFDFAIWSRNEPRRPILLVCEEAHRYVPNERHADDSSVGRILGRIAKEGRKYGVSLGLITQRPSDLAEGVLSQCGTIIAMRLNNDRDQAFVRSAMPEGARGFLDTIPALRNRECIICGEGVAIPIRVVLDALEATRRPASADPVFSELWCETGGEDQIITRTVRRWRSQGR